MTAGRQTFAADLVVAADGIDSAVRARLAPESAVVSSGCTAWRAVIPWYRAPKLPDGRPVGGETLGAGYRFVAASLGERGSSGGSTRGGVYWVATAAGAPRPGATGHPAGPAAPVVRGLARADHRPARRHRARRPGPAGGARAAAAAARVRVRLRAGRRRAARRRGARHAAPPRPGRLPRVRGRGHAPAAVRDASTGLPLRRAIEGYDRERRPRAATMVRQTRRMSAVLQTRGRLALRARDAALGQITPRLLGSAASTAAQWRPPA